MQLSDHESAHSAPEVKPYIVWQVLDGKPGHENQTYGLTEALARQSQVESHPVSLEQHGLDWLDYVLRRPSTMASSAR